MWEWLRSKKFLVYKLQSLEAKVASLERESSKRGALVLGLQESVADKNAEIGQTLSKMNDLGRSNVDKDKEISRLTKENADLKAQLGEQLETDFAIKALKTLGIIPERVKERRPEKSFQELYDEVDGALKSRSQSASGLSGLYWPTRPFGLDRNNLFSCRLSQ